jgi:hypothetical protein
MVKTIFGINQMAAHALLAKATNERSFDWWLNMSLNLLWTEATDLHTKIP